MTLGTETQGFTEQMLASWWTSLFTVTSLPESGSSRKIGVQKPPSPAG